MIHVLYILIYAYFHFLMAGLSIALIKGSTASIYYNYGESEYDDVDGLLLIIILVFAPIVILIFLIYVIAVVLYIHIIKNAAKPFKWIGVKIYDFFNYLIEEYYYRDGE